MSGDWLYSLGNGYPNEFLLNVPRVQVEYDPISGEWRRFLTVPNPSTVDRSEYRPHMIVILLRLPY